MVMLKLSAFLSALVVSPVSALSTTSVSPMEQNQRDWARLRNSREQGGADAVLHYYGSVSDELRNDLGECVAEGLVQYRGGGRRIDFQATGEHTVGDSKIRVTMKIEVEKN